MIFADKLIALRKGKGWSQEELAEKLCVTCQSVSKWEGDQSMPDVDKIVLMSRLFGVTTDYLLKEEQTDPEHTESEPSPLPCVTLPQAEEYLAGAEANAPRMALATALCIVSPAPLLLLGAMSEYARFGIDENVAGGLGLIVLLVLVAAAVVLFMQCDAAVRRYAFLEKEPIETERGVREMASQRRDELAPQYNRANSIGTVLCILAAVPLFAGMALGVESLMAAAVCAVLALVACGCYAFVRVGTVEAALDRLLEEGDYTRPAKARRGRLNALAAAYWLAVTAIFLYYTYGPDGNGKPQYSWVVWAIAGVLFAAGMAVVKAFLKKKE